MSSFQNPAYTASRTTKGIKVTVETYYQNEFSNPVSEDYTFAYRITIENNNNFPVQLLKRFWNIFDSTSEVRHIEGDGVVGNQPVIYPGDQYQYVSGCNLNSDMGRMDGRYMMVNMHTKKSFMINIPAFEMVVPFKMN